MAFPDGWSNHKITIDNTKVAGAVDFTNEPVLLVSGNFLPGVWGSAQSGGQDLRFTSDLAGSDIFPHDVITWATASGTSGTADVRVRVGTVAVASDTNFFVWFGNGTATLPSGTSTWSNSYSGVYELDGNLNDRTSNGYNLTSGSLPTSVPTGGQIAGGYSFASASTNYATAAGPLIQNSQTWKFWAKHKSLGNQRVLGMSTAGAGNGWINVILDGATNTYRFQYDHDAGNISATTAATVAVNQFHQIIGRYDHIGSILSIALDGVNVSLSEVPVHPASGGEFGLGRMGGYDADYFDGTLDSAHIISAVRTAEWGTTVYNMESSPTTFSTPSESATTFNSALSSSFALTDGLDTTSIWGRALSSTSSLSDNLDSVLLMIINVTMSDTMGVLDSVERVANAVRINVSNMSLAETQKAALTISTALQDSMGVSDVLTTTLERQATQGKHTIIIEGIDGFKPSGFVESV